MSTFVTKGSDRNADRLGEQPVTEDVVPYHLRTVPLTFTLRDDAKGTWASFWPVIGPWAHERLSIDVGDNRDDHAAGVVLGATARPTSSDPPDAPEGPGIFALRWFVVATADVDEFVELSAAAWPAFEAGTPGTRIFGLFTAEGDPTDATDPTEETRLLLCTRYPSLAGWESSRADTGSPEFRRRRELTRRTQVSVWRLRD